MAKTHAQNSVVSFDAGTLRVWGMAGSGFSVNLIGPVTVDWAAEFREAEKTLILGHHFHLEQERRVVAFHCEPSSVEGVLGELVDLVNIVNLGARRTTSQAPSEYLRSGGRTTEASARSRATRPRKRISE
jgi:hypothetical protein